MKVIALLFLSFAVFISSMAHAVVIPDPPELSAKGYVLMDFNSGDVLAENNADVKIAPASLTKLMTAYVVGKEIDSGRLTWETPVAVSRKAWSANFPESSKMFIKPGDAVTVKELMLGLIVQSGNDAAVALAEHVAGDEVAFVSLMNGWAQSLGMNNTYFVNAHGLDGEDISTTPRDMALLLKSVIQDVPEVYALYEKRSFSWAGIQQYNRNKLLWDKTLNVDGGKTGYTENAGYSLVSSAIQGKMRLISVVMGTAGSQIRVNESRQLLNYGFRFFETLQVATKDEVIYEAEVWQGNRDSVAVTLEQDLFLTLPRTQAASLNQELELEPNLKAPIAKGETIGKVIWSVDGQEVKSSGVRSAAEVEPGSLFKRLKDAFLLWLSAVIADIGQLFSGAS